MSRSEQVQLFGSTDVGRRRPHNEDNFLVDRELGLAIVADGMGGHAAGEVASELAVETIHEILQRNREPLLERAERGSRSEVTPKQVLALIETAIQNASARIHSLAQGDPTKRGMGTTLSMVLVLDTLAYVAHVGDSRVYLLRAGTVRQLTEDHTMAAEMLKLGMVTADRLDKVPHRNAITRAVGIYPHVNVDTFTCEVVPGDQLLLATDGFTGYLRSQEELTAAASMPDGEQAVRSCIDLANERGGKDNITVLLLRFGRAGADDGVRARRLALKHEVLAQVPLFCRLEQRELESIAGIATVGVYEPGEAVMREGEEGDELYVLLTGRLSVSRGEALLGELGPGEHLGEMALIRTTPRSATVTAVVESELVSIKRRDFYEVIRTEPSVAVKLLWQFVLVLANRLEQTSQDLSVARRALAAPEPRTVPRPPAGSLGGGLGLGAPSQEPDEAPDADPFSGPPPASLGRFRLGYATLQHDAVAPEQRSVADTLREGSRQAAEAQQAAAWAEAHAPQQTAARRVPAGNAPDALPAAWQAIPLGDATLPGIGGPGRALHAGSGAGSGEPSPVAARRPPPLQHTVRSAGNPVLPPPVAPPAAQPPPPQAGPAAPDRPGLDAAGATPAGETPDDHRPTIPLGPRRPYGPVDDVSDTAKTRPIRGDEPLREELDQLRKEFKERLRKARESGGGHESD